MNQSSIVVQYLLVKMPFLNSLEKVYFLARFLGTEKGN